MVLNPALAKPYYKYYKRLNVNSVLTNQNVKRRALNEVDANLPSHVAKICYLADVSSAWRVRILLTNRTQGVKQLNCWWC